ncbi:sensor domain-containing diguanylate cyclase [Thermomonas carbonis]|uniref:diguanylate cyclase n=1 Tax=Thermomonas carbonis TaxID=1463158 RepID=A0A7G9SPF6_9GAMM|nr:GGDEF domain-containing protein [Thermomonas carbonis]QNN69731.1 diguanylate cyclase AdrA [Thermomonas carbonis]GHB95138.1 diguanylate cyclase AdrA [Thermomonas carbonis]
MTRTNHREDGDGTDVPPHLRNLHRRTYPMRTLGMGLAVLPVLVVLHELDTGWPAWAWTLFCSLVWPHVAWLRARHSRVPYRAELTNFMIDSAMAASLAPIMHFNLLPSAMLVTLATADKINAGVRGLWSRSLLGMLVAILVTSVLTGFQLDIATSTPVLLACLPLMVIHTLAVSVTSYRLVRKVQKQNLRLDDLSRHDALTGLLSRGHWQEQATTLLVAGAPASLLLVDVDLFKSINDHHGHATGDDVLRGIADAIRAAVPDGSHAGRLGGDEFAVAVPLALTDSRHVAEDIRARVEALQLDDAPVQCSVSIGMAEPPLAGTGLRAWMESADRALYRAKAAGRNRIQAATPDSLPA